jgi:hypothetical protein
VSQTNAPFDGKDFQPVSQTERVRPGRTRSHVRPLNMGDAQAPLISLITPSFNQARFIRETIESVLSQDYANLEYWVIDGGSTDDTPDILCQYAQDRRFHWLSEPDRGQSEALNKGLALCHGQLCGWLNSDDVLLPGALGCLAAAWTTSSEPAILYGLGRHIDECGRDLGYCPAQSQRMSLEKLLWVGKHALVQPATFAPTDAIRLAGSLNPDLHYALDLDLWLRLAETLPLKCLERDLALYRLHAASKTVAASTRFVDEVHQVLAAAARRGTLPAQMAQSRSELFGLRTYLMPGVFNWTLAWGCLQRAIRAEGAVLPEAMLIVLKALVRLAGGQRLWTRARLLKARFG